MDSPSLPEEAMTPQEKDNDKQIETPYTQGSPEACSPEMEGVKSDLACKFANEEDAPPKSKYNRTTKIMCFCVGFLMVAAVVITAVLLTYDGTESKNINQFENDAEKSPIAPIAPSPPVAAPVAPIFSQPMAPVATPTSPVATPTAPVGTPTAPNPTASPTLNPTALPTPTPSVSVQSRIVEFLATNQVVVNSQDPSSNMAITVLAEELGDLETVDPSKVIQRFAILTVDFALRASGRVDAPAPDIDTPVDGNTADAPIGGNTTGGFLDATDGDATDVPLGDGNATGGFFDTTNGDDTATTNPSTTDTDQGNGGFFDAGSDSFADAFGGMRRLELSMDECLWDGVTCIDGIVTEIRFHNQLMEGTIPTEIALLSGLKYLDLSQNQLQGMIPEALYELVEIEDVFLYQNQLTGSISSSVGNWLNITHLHLSHNQLTGSIPSTMASGSSTRPYYYINFKSNRLTGTIPSSLRWRQLYYLDLGNNQLTGTLPSDLGETFGSLRHLHLDHNQFVGMLPESYITVGNGRLEQLSLNDNQLTGAVPGNHESYRSLVLLRLENNNFDQSLDSATCRLSVFLEGENVELKADCDICSCRGDFVCSNC